MHIYNKVLCYCACSADCVPTTSYSCCFFTFLHCDKRHCVFEKCLPAVLQGKLTLNQAFPLGHLHQGHNMILLCSFLCKLTDVSICCQTVLCMLCSIMVWISKQFHWHPRDCAATCRRDDETSASRPCWHQTHVHPGDCDDDAFCSN